MATYELPLFSQGNWQQRSSYDLIVKAAVFKFLWTSFLSCILINLEIESKLTMNIRIPLIIFILRNFIVKFYYTYRLFSSVFLLPSKDEADPSFRNTYKYGNDDVLYRSVSSNCEIFFSVVVFLFLLLLRENVCIKISFIKRQGEYGLNFFE